LNSGPPERKSPEEREKEYEDGFKMDLIKIEGCEVY
jgi:hypothetical protein